MGIIETSDVLSIKQLLELKTICRDFMVLEDKECLDSLSSCFRRNILRRVDEYDLIEHVPKPSLLRLMAMKTQFRKFHLTLESPEKKIALSRLVGVISEEIEILKKTRIDQLTGFVLASLEKKFKEGEEEETKGEKEEEETKGEKEKEVDVEEKEAEK